MIGHQRIKTFVRNTLGCSCPEEVFLSIDCRTRFRADGIGEIAAAITVGNRLLIYVVEADKDVGMRQRLPPLVAAGRRKRDALGLNRFRLVVVCDDTEEMTALQESFETLQEKDDKVHLHLIGKRDNPFSKENIGLPD